MVQGKGGRRVHGQDGRFDGSAGLSWWQMGNSKTSASTDVF